MAVCFTAHVKFGARNRAGKFASRIHHFTDRQTTVDYRLLSCP